MRATTWSRGWFWCGLAFLLLSLFLPVIDAGNYRHQSIDLPGWAAVLVSMMLGVWAVAGLFAASAEAGPLQIVPALAVLSILNFGLAGIWLRKGCGPGRLATCLGRTIPIGLVLSLMAPYCVSNEGVLAGYYVWLLAHACLLVAVVSARRQQQPWT